MIVIITEFIKVWLKEIVVLFIIISLIDIIMPKGKMKKFVDFIVGILIIFTIISPLTRINDINIDLDKAVSNFTDDTVSEKSLTKLQNNQIRDIYTSNLKVEIQELIEDNSEYKVKDINLDTLPDDESIFVLNEINIRLSQLDIRDKEIIVDKVEIQEKAVEASYLDSESDLVNLVANLVQVEPEKVNISIKD